MLSRSCRSFVVFPCCAFLTICIVELLSANLMAKAKSPDIAVGIHQEGSLTLTFHEGILDELGWNVPSGVEQASANEPSQIIFPILPGSNLQLTNQASQYDRPQGVIDTRGAFFLNTQKSFYQIGTLSIEARDNGFWYVTASNPGNADDTIEFDFLPDIIDEDVATARATITGELCLARSSAAALGASRYQGTCIASLIAELEFIEEGKSTRFSIDSFSKTSTGKISAKAAGACTMDTDCAAGQVCDLSEGTCKNGPDLIVFDLQNLIKNGRDDALGITSFSIGTTSCNIGDMPAAWFSREDGPQDEQRHPVIAQNVYRYNEERLDGNGIVIRPSSLEQIGMSWVKHGFASGSGGLCNAPGTFCDISAGVNYLGVNCSDSYSATLNGFQGNLGPRYEVNPVTGLFACWDQRDAISNDCTPAPDLCFPCSSNVDSPTTITRRIQLHDDDLSPALNPNSHYIAEGHYVSADDANAQNDDNNISYREYALSESIPTFFNFSSISLTPTQQMKSAIQAWQDFDPSVDIQAVDVVNDGRFLVAAKATAIGDGTWHYEYAIQNMNSDRSGRAFSVPIPSGATVLSTGFHDIDSHSNSPYSSVDWTSLETSGSLQWSTDTQAIDPFANALRWGTAYNFRFVSDTCPTTGDATLGLFKPLGGDPDSVLVTTIIPSDCATCEAAITLNTSDPAAGFVDVLQPTEPDGSNVTGVHSIEYTFNDFPGCVTPMPGDFATLQVGGMGIAPTPDTAEKQLGGEIRVALSAPINPGARTTITHTLSGIGVELGFLPGDVDRDGTTNPNDLIALAISLDSLSLPLTDSDMDRNGNTSAADLLRLVDLLQGAGIYEVWDGSSLP